MRIIKTKVYTFDELSDRAKERAREWMREFALDFDWWEPVYEDAARIGLKLTGFDLDRSLHATGDLTVSVGECARRIINEHGKECDTYKLARDYYKQKHVGAPMSEEDFTHDLLECYAQMLQREYEYRLSDEAIDEDIKANEYTFTADGTREG